MPIPDITHLQFLLLNHLATAEWVSGRELRSLLEKEGAKKSAPSFYQLMSRLEESGFVQGEYETKRVGDQTVKSRRYMITGDGLKVHGAVSEFYASRLMTGGLANA